MEPVASSGDPSKIPEPIQKDPKWLARLAWAILVGALLFQAYAYYFKLPLSLGPRVILQPWLLRHGFILYETAVDIHTPLMPLSIAALSSVIPDGLRLAKLIKRLLGAKSRIVHRPLPVDDPKQRCPDISLAKQSLKWRPEMSLEDGLKRTIAYFSGAMRTQTR